MGLRVFLVALVASLGLELPGGDEFASWHESGRRWLSSRMGDLSKGADWAGRLVDGSEEPSEVCLPGPSKRDDLAFEAVVEGMASSFAVDLASNSEDSGKTLPPVVDLRVEPTPVEAPTVAEATDSTSSRLEKIGTAVKLTRQAMDAWASLIRPVAEEGTTSREEDSL